jgi:hypothetical protein
MKKSIAIAACTDERLLRKQPGSIAHRLPRPFEWVTH